MAMHWLLWMRMVSKLRYCRQQAKNVCAAGNTLLMLVLILNTLNYAPNVWWQLVVSKITDQLAKFDQLWQEACDLWPPPGFTRKLHAGTKQEWNIIAIPEENSWKSLAPIIEVVGEQWPWHTPYTIPQLHITIAGLGDSIDWTKKENELKSILNKATAKQGPIRVDLHGINILRNTIIVQIIDVEGGLKNLVSQVTKEIKKEGLVRNYRAGLHSELWWTSIIRLYKPIPDELLSFVSNFRNTLFASILINSIELCNNNKTFESWKALHTLRLDRNIQQE